MVDQLANVEPTPLSTILVSAFVGEVVAIFTNRIALKHQIQAENKYAILMKIWNRAYWLRSRPRPLPTPCPLWQLKTVIGY